MMCENYKRIAIVKLSAMGDIIHTMIVLQYIKENYPNIIIDWFVEETFSKVLEFNPHIDNIYKLNLKKIKKNKFEIFNQIKIIRTCANNYDLIIDAQGLIKSAIVSRLLGKNVIGFSKESTREKFSSFFYSKKVHISYDKNVIDRNIRLIEESLNIKIPKLDILNKKAFLFFSDLSKNKIDNYISKNKKNILLVIGASWKSKMYSPDKFINIINQIDENFLIIWGNEEEKTIAEYIQSKSKALMIDKLNLDELKCLISKVDVVLGNDTGPSHMAWANNISSLLLFGNTPGYRNTYETNINKYLQSNKNVNPFKLDRNDFSINNIQEIEVIKLLKEILYD